jgi:1,4-alpha-glucan branching enzyme
MIGEIDLHLFGEGRHEEIYKKLGAHVTKVGRTKGVSFAVWAPHANGVSVVGRLGWESPSDAYARHLGCLGVVRSKGR